MFCNFVYVFWLRMSSRLGRTGARILQGMSVFVTGNKIYTVGCRITSVMVAQDARKGRRVLDRFGPSGEVIPYVLFVAVLFLCSNVTGCVSPRRCVRSRVARGVW